MIAAAVVGSLVGTAALEPTYYGHSIDPLFLPFSQATLIFTLSGSWLIFCLGLLLRHAGVRDWIAALTLLAGGTLLGAGILSLGGAGSGPVGAVYGFATSLAVVALERMLRTSAAT